MGTAPATDVHAMLARADDYAARGDARAAISFYQAALKGSRSSFADAATLDRLRLAQAYIQQQALAFEAAIDDAVATATPANKIAQTRLNHALEMLKGRRQVYLQQPSVLYYPYLSQRQFFEREEFDWVPAIEEAAPAIREELTELLGDADFRPYVESEPDRPYRDFHGLNEDPSWSALYLWRDGKPVEANARRCPRTMAALEQVPLTSIGSRTPAVLFSRLEPGAHIPAHGGMVNCRLICHLPLIVPQGCWLRVGNETRQWEEGKVLIFDDSIEHEAKNPTDEIRIILLFDVWRPELTQEERIAISALFGAIDRFRGTPRD